MAGRASVGFDLKPYIISICLSFRSSASLPPPFRSSLLYLPTHIRREHQKGKSSFRPSPSPSPSHRFTSRRLTSANSRHITAPLSALPSMIIKQSPSTHHSTKYTTTHPQPLHQTPAAAPSIIHVPQPRRKRPPVSDLPSQPAT